MKNVFAGVLGVVFILSGLASQAGVMGEKHTPEEVGPISIALNDNAKDACWTNLREVREYAEEKLRIRGFTIGTDDRAIVDYTLVVNVDAFRSKVQPICVGSVIAMVMKGSTGEKLFGFHFIHMENVVATTKPDGNLNQEVIKLVQKTIDEL